MAGSSGSKKKRCLSVCVATALAVAGCGDDGERVCTRAAPLAVLSAFPAEMAAMLAHARGVRVVEAGGHKYRLADIGGRHVVIAMTGIGLANARRVTRLTLEQFGPAGVVVVGVAGSSRVPIGSVAVPRRWRLSDGREFVVDPQWWQWVEANALHVDPLLARCGMAYLAGGAMPVCMPEPPRLLALEVALSDDPFAGQPFPCQEGGDDLYGCDLPPSRIMGGTGTQAANEPAHVPRNDEGPWINDMESAAIAEVASEYGIPFIAFRAVSDGPGDPLGLRNFLLQFTAYYRYAAANAAVAANAFLATMPCP
ncbi:MAG: hypothetical protein N3C12_07200 [Candidatus Binatia bacterium]|nr:hypothetical protein [Candidatus Binatia bacterium]